VNKNAAKYRAALLSVETVITNPTTDKHSAGMMWKERSFILSEFQAKAKLTKAAKI